MSNDSKRKLSIIIPVFNERDTIQELLRRVSTATLPHGWIKEIIIVDDHSHDGTIDILKAVPDCKLVFCGENAGKGAAIKEGLKVVTGEYVLIQDADLEYDPADYSALIKPILDGRAKVVFGSRTLAKNKVSARHVYFYGGLLITKIYNLFFSKKITDIATCYKIFPARYIPDLIKLKSNDFVYDVIELSHYLGAKERILEVPINYEARSTPEGKKMNWRHGAKCFMKILTLFGKSFSHSKPWMSTALVFTLFFSVFMYVYFSVSTFSSGDDHFFHFRFAHEMLQNGFFESFQNFQSIYFSKMAHGNEYFMYYNFLFYLLVIPFTFITPLFVSIKLYAVFVAATAFTLLYWCLKKIEIQNPFIWTLVMIAITNTTSIWRFFLSRPYTLAPSLLLLLLYFLYKKNHWGVFILSFLYLFWHSSTFFLPVCVAIGYYIIEWFYKERGNWKNLVGAIAGTVLAILATLLVNGGFLTFIWDTLVQIYWETIIGKEVNIGEGKELYPVDFFDYIQGNAIIFAVFVMALSVDLFSYFGFKRKYDRKVSIFEDTDQVVGDYFSDVPKERRHLQTTVLILTALFFLGTVTASARFGDYFTFFAALYIALSFDYMRRLVKISGAPLIRQSLLVGTTIVLVYMFTSNMLFLQRKIAFGQSLTQFYQIGSWLDRNSDPGDIVFMANWSWFPQLYHWSPKNYYNQGLEPRFSYAYDPELFWKGNHIAVLGMVCDKEECPDKQKLLEEAIKSSSTTEQWAKTEGNLIAFVFRDEFRAKFIVSSREHKFFNYILTQNPNFKLELYNEAYGNLLFRVLDKPENTK